MSRIETDKMEIAHDLFDFTAFVEEINQIIYPQTLEREIAMRCVTWNLWKAIILGIRCA